MNKYICVVATKEELKLIKNTEDRAKAIIIGEGALNVLQELKDLDQDIEIRNYGYCGSNNFKKGKTLEVTNIRTYHPGVNLLEDHPQIKHDSKKRVTCYTALDFVKEPVNDETAIYDMELAFIVAIHPNTRAYKTVSDNLNYKDYKKAMND